MICIPCRDSKHGDCPELARQADKGIGKIDKLGGDLCYCHHVVIPVPEPVLDSRYAACPVKPRKVG